VRHDDPTAPLKVLTLNLHKGFTAMNRRFVLPALKAAPLKVDSATAKIQRN